MPDSILLKIGVGILSAVLRDAAKARLGTMPDPMRDAVRITSEEFRQFEGVENSLNRLIAAPQTGEVFHRFLAGDFAAGDVPLADLSSALMDENVGDFFLVELQSETANQIVQRFVSNLRERYLLEPGLATKLVADRQETIALQQGAQLEGIQQSLRGIREDTSTVVGNSLDSQLDEIAGLIETHQYPAAHYQIEKLRKRWDSLVGPQRFRLLTQSGSVCFGEGDLAAAVKFYREALTYNIGTEKYAEVGAFAPLLAGDRQRAFEMSKASLKEFPGSGRLASTFVQSAPDDWTVHRIMAEFSPPILDHSEVLTALTTRALSEGEHSLAVELSTKALKTASWSGAYLAHGRALLVSSLAASDGLQQVREAKGQLEKAIQLAINEKSKAINAAALVDHGQCQRLLGDTAAGMEDFKEAYRLNPDDPIVVSSYADQLAESGHRSDALGILRSAGLAAFPGAKLKAGEILSRGSTAEKREAASLFVDLALLDTKDTLASGHAAGRAVDIYLDIGETTAAKEFLETSGAKASTLTRLVLSARVQEALGNQAQAARHYQEAIGAVSGTTPRHELSLLGTALVNAGKPADALQVFERLVTGTELNYATKVLLSSAAACGRDDVVLSTCKRLREAGVRSQEAVMMEINLLEHYDLDGAIEVLQNYLAGGFDPLVQLRLSLIGIQRGRPNLIDSDPTHVPKPAELDVRFGRAAVHVLKFGGHPDAALRYGYELLRKHFHDSDAHMAFMVNLHPFDPKPNVPRDIRMVAADTAVGFKESEDDPERWLILEPAVPADPKLDEIDPGHDLWKELEGKRVGETFTISRSSVADRKGTVTSIMSKYVYRYQDCGSNWELRFPDRPLISSVRIRKTANDEFDFSAIFKSLDRKQENLRQLSDLYRAYPVSLEMFGQKLGRNALDTLLYFATNPNETILVCQGTAPERAAALQVLASPRQIVIDLTAIATISLLKIEHIIEQWPGELIVGQATYGELEEMLYEANLTVGTEGGSLAKIGEKYSMETTTQDQRIGRRDQLRYWLDLLRNKCKIYPGLELAAIDPEVRQNMISAFGQHGAEAILIARGSDRLLWTDDHVVAGYSAGNFGVSRVWSQVVIEAAAASGAISNDDFAESTAKLIGCNYVFTSPGQAAFKRAAEIAKWSPNDWPLKQCLELMLSESISVDGAAALLLRLLLDSYAGQLDQSHQAGMLDSILSALWQRTGGQFVMAKLPETLRLLKAKGLATSQLIEDVERWLASRQS